jgi:hypothetical protein
MGLEQETELTKVRQHWGMFIPVLLFAFALVLALLPFIFIFHAADDVLLQLGRRLNQPPIAPRLNRVWMLALVPYSMMFLGSLLGTWLSYSKSEVTLTNRRLIFRTGFLSRRSGELPLENIESIFMAEPLLGRLCGYGTVMVTTVGGARFPLSFIGTPRSFHSTLQKAVLNAKDSAGSQI